MDYKVIDELIVKAKDGDRVALGELLEIYDGLIKKYSKRFFIKGFDNEDLEQIAAMAIIQCAFKFDVSVGANFTGFADRVIRYTFINLINRKENQNHDASLENLVEEGIEMKDAIPDDFNLEESFLKDEEMEELKVALKKLTKEEQQLLYATYSEHGGLKNYSRKMGISYRKCIYKREKVLNKLRGMILE